MGPPKGGGPEGICQPRSQAWMDGVESRDEVVGNNERQQSDRVVAKPRIARNSQPGHLRPLSEGWRTDARVALLVLVLTALHRGRASK